MPRKSFEYLIQQKKFLMDVSALMVLALHQFLIPIENFEVKQKSTVKYIVFNSFSSNSLLILTWVEKPKIYSYACLKFSLLFSRRGRILKGLLLA